MDGTLWDSAIQVAKSWNIALAKLGYERAPITEEDMQRVMGKTMDDIAAILFPDEDENYRKKILERCCEEENAYLREQGGILYDMVRETIAELKKEYHIYIVSNCQSGYIEAFLDHYQLWDFVEDFECYGNNGNQKAENIRLVVERNRLNDAVYVGDIQGDYDASQEAGMKFIHAAYGFGTIAQTVPAIQSFEELPLILKKYF